MPRFDGTGPMGQGPMTGRGFGPCAKGLRRGFGMGFCRGWRVMDKEEKNKILTDYKKFLEEELEAVKKETDALTK